MANRFLVSDVYIFRYIVGLNYHVNRRQFPLRVNHSHKDCDVQSWEFKYLITHYVLQVFLERDSFVALNPFSL